MPRSILHFSDWNFHHVFETHMQVYSEPSLFSFCFHTRYGHFLFFMVFWIGHISLQNKNRTGWHLKGWLVQKETRCQEIASKYLLFSGTWPINRSSSALAGPARMEIHFPNERMLNFFFSCGNTYLIPVTTSSDAPMAVDY